MSSITRSTWRVPQYRVGALTPLLLNESLGAADPHGPGQHSNRTFVDVLGAPGFNGTLTLVNGHVAVIFSDAADITVRGSLRIPKGAVSLDSVQALFVDASGANPGGDIMLGIAALALANGDDVVAPVFVPAATAVAAQEATAKIRRVGAVGSAPSLSGKEFVHLTIQRDATDAGDTLNRDLWLLGAYISWISDQ